MRVTQRQGFTLIELVLVVAFVAILWTVLLQRVQLTHEKAYAAAFKGVAGAFRSAIRLAHSSWLLETSTGTAVKTLALRDGSVVGVTKKGWPVHDGTLDIDENLSPAQLLDVTFDTYQGSSIGCADVWNLLLEPGSPQAAVTEDAAFHASYASPICTYVYTLRQGYHVLYNVKTGAIAVVTKIKFDA